MFIKSLRNLRYYYKTHERQKTDRNIDTDFVGVYYDEGPRRITGLFELFHADKKIDKFLPSLLKIAEDGQAIYEFLQNAADCDSTQFFIFYNEHYFLAVNNGRPFNHKDVLSILNIANSTKDAACDKIGRFGIGFKLVHRLVGRDEGIRELIEEYKGPVVFSWNHINELKALLRKEAIKPFSVAHPDEFDTAKCPWLFKIITTNFPASPGEEVKDIKFQKRVVFPEEELHELIDFLKLNFKNHQGFFDFDKLEQGSLFFLKLGEGKSALLDKDYHDLERGVQYSMNFLKNLQAVFINDRALKKEPLTIRKFEIPKDSVAFKAINPEYRDCPIKIVFAYTDYQRAQALRKAPSFYKYFPMGDETNGFSFIIHCDSFDIEANRRKLHESNKNKQLLPEIAAFIKCIADDLKKSDFEEFARLYANLLLSAVPVNENNRWLNACFFDHLLEYMKGNVPVRKAHLAINPLTVKIKNFRFMLRLSDLGFVDHYWFYWFPNKDEPLTTAAADKLGLESWRLRDVFIQADIQVLNAWIKKLASEDYGLFIAELDKEYLTDAGAERLPDVELFKFSDGNFYSIRQVYEEADLLFFSPQVSTIREELEVLGFYLSELDIAKFNFYEKISNGLNDQESIYEHIASRTAVPNKLTAHQKIKLFNSMSDPNTKFTGIAKDTLNKLQLFCNAAGEIRALRDLLPTSLNTPLWLSAFKIRAAEYETGLDKYLMTEAEIYVEIILPAWEELSNEPGDTSAFYREVARYFALEENNAPLSKQSFILTAAGMKTPGEIFYSRHLRTINNYDELEAAFSKLSTLSLPVKNLLPIFEQPPFKLENDRLNDIALDEDAALTILEAKALIDFAVTSGDHFFEDYLLEKKPGGIFVRAVHTGLFQYYSSDMELTALIGEELADRFFLLPKELAEFREQTGVLREEALHLQVVGTIDVEENFEQLVAVVKYEEAKKALLIRLPAFTIEMTGDEVAAVFSAKVLDMACKNLSGVNLQEQFKSKLSLQTAAGLIKVSQVAGADDRIYFASADVTLSLSALLPQEFKNADVLRDALRYYIIRGVPEVHLKKILGIQQEIDLTHVLKLVGTAVDSADKLAFVLLYHRYCEPVNLGDYKVNTAGGDYSLQYEYYTGSFGFIDEDAILSETYKKISSILELPFQTDQKGETWLYEEPLLAETGLHCKYLKTSPSQQEQLELLDWLFGKWNNGQKELIRKTDWSKVGEQPAKTMLGFDPGLTIFPARLAMTEEQLPQGVQEWMEVKPDAEAFLFNLGMHGSGSPVQQARAYFAGEGSFQPGRLLMVDNQVLLQQTLSWLQASDIKIQSQDGYETLKELVSTLNRLSGKVLKLDELFDYKRLEAEAEELADEDYLNWKEAMEDKYVVFLYPGTLPKYLLIDSFGDYRFREFSADHVTITEDNVIYIDREKNVQQLLHQLVSQEQMDADDLLRFIQIGQQVSGPGEVQGLKDRIQQLENMIANLHRVIGRDGSDITSRVDQYTDVIKEKSERFLFEHLSRLYPGRVEWLNGSAGGSFRESWQQHDFRILDGGGSVVTYIDCKGTPAGKRTFYVTQNEWEFFLAHEDQYAIWRVFDVESKPGFLHIDNLLNWILAGKVVPYLEATELIAGGKVFLTVR